MQITASIVKKLRERTGAGMMDCKKALQKTNGDIESAIETMRKLGVVKAAKKADRITADGIILLQKSTEEDLAVLLEINCETDFAAKDKNFQAFAKAVGESILTTASNSVGSLKGSPIAGKDGQSVEQARLELVVKIGENVDIRRFQIVNISDGSLGSYIHGGRIGVLVDLHGGDDELAKDIAMHIAVSRPLCVTESEVPQETLNKEKEIFIAQAKESGKPEDIVEKMVSGRIKKYLNEITLLRQPFVKDPDQKVATLLKSKGATVNAFVRYEVGEGIEKNEDNFVEEVMAQAKIWD